MPAMHQDRASREIGLAILDHALDHPSHGQLRVAHDWARKRWARLHANLQRAWGVEPTRAAVLPSDDP